MKFSKFEVKYGGFKQILIKIDNVKLCAVEMEDGSIHNPTDVNAYAETEDEKKQRLANILATAMLS